MVASAYSVNKRLPKPWTQRPPLVIRFDEHADNMPMSNFVQSLSIYFIYQLACKFASNISTSGGSAHGFATNKYSQHTTHP